MDTDFFQQLEHLILSSNVDKKCDGIQYLFENLSSMNDLDHAQAVIQIAKPGLPEILKLVAPKDLAKRRIGSVEGRLVLMHSIAHIEFNAINLAMDAAYRFRNLPPEYYRDWVGVAADEARHFKLIQNYLNKEGVEYGDYVAHNGLWDMAVQTAHDVIARMALVPRVLEARGLDVTPSIIEKLKKVEDQPAVEILNTIYYDEIEHVKTGSRWFKYLCEREDLEPRETFISMIDKHFHGTLRGPFNMVARLLAGFDEGELDSFQ